MKKKLLSLLLSLCLVLSAALPASALDLEQARELLQAYYVDELPPEVLNASTIEEMLSALNDPYTEYMDTETYARFLSSVNGDSVVGIGVSIQTIFDNGYKILSILPGSPALEAGLEAGDVVVAVDGTPLTAELDVRGMIAGQAGTPVRITVIRAADGTTQDFVMDRRQVEIPIVTYEKIGRAGSIDCISFGESTVPTVREALTELNGSVSAWIMDLRSNPGGTSSAACGTAGLFAGPGMMVRFADSFGNSQTEYTGVQDLTDKPLIVLTSSYSASGSELFAAAVRDYGVGIAMGQRTFGKGIAQFVLDRSNDDYFDGDCMKITAYRFYSPDGTTNHLIGVLPTLSISSENVERAALLLTCPPSSFAKDRARLEIAGQTLTIDLKEAAKKENRAAFTELLEALPPSAKLYRGTGEEWQEIAPATLASVFGLDYAKRTFSDVSHSPYRREIDTLAVHLLFTGCEDGNFRPEDPVTRAEFCDMVAAALNLPAGASKTFSDVPEDAWYADAVSALAARGFISGTGNGTFDPDGTITYEQMVTVLASVAAWANTEAAQLAAQGLPITDVLDHLEFSPWAQTSARVLDKLDALVGEQAPGDSGTRETAAALICTLMENIHLIWD